MARVPRSVVARLDRRRRPGRAPRAPLPQTRRARAGAALCNAGAAGNGRATPARPRRPRVRRVRRLDAFPRRDELGGADPAAPCGADPADRPQRDLLRVGALRRGAHPRAPARAHEARLARKADRDGREPRCVGDAARARSPPAVLRRVAAAVGQLLPPAVRQAGVDLPSLPAHHPFRGRRAARRRRARSRSRSPAGPPRRTGRTTARSQMRSWSRATRPGSPRCATPTPGRAGATDSTRTCPP